MNINLAFDEIRRKAAADSGFAAELLRSAESDRPFLDFCRTCRTAGIEIYPMDIVDVEESAYASMRRSTNGGGENSPHLQWDEGIFAELLDEIRDAADR